MVKKVIFVVLGLLLLVPGIGLAVAGGGLLALGGRSGDVQSGFHTVNTPTSALVSDVTVVNNRTAGATLTVAARNSTKPVFIGVGPSAEVAEYLSGVAFSEVSEVDLRPFRMTTREVPGSNVPAMPDGQLLWEAKASGTDVELVWPVVSGDYRVVVMNADGSPDINTEVQLGMKIPALFGIGLGTLVAGILLCLLALGLIIWGIMAKRRPPAPAEQPLELPGFAPR